MSGKARSNFVALPTAKYTDQKGSKSLLRTSTKNDAKLHHSYHGVDVGYAFANGDPHSLPNFKRSTSGANRPNMRNQQRLSQPTFASAMRSAGNRQIVLKKQQERALAINERTDTKNTRPTKWDAPINATAVRSNVRAGKIDKIQTSTNTKLAAHARTAESQLKSSNRDARVSKLNKEKQEKFKEKQKPEQLQIDVPVHDDESENLSKMPKQILEELGIQTNEAEILNHDLLIGDIKLMTPSQKLIDEIEKAREQAKIKQQHDSMRKFNSYEQHEESHLIDLQEYIDRNYVTKRPNKPRSTSIFEPNDILKTMDEMLMREVPKAESITNIRDRIKRKEMELLRLFDNVDKDGKSKR